MNEQEILAYLSQHQVTLAADGDELVINGRKEVLDATLLAAMKRLKPSLLAHCRQNAGAPSITPSMLPLVTLSQQQIDAIVASMPHGAGQIEDIYPLSPLQEGILFHHLLDEQGDTYLLRSVVAFDTEARRTAFLVALQAVLNRHPVLRSAVRWQDLPHPVQVVYREVALPVYPVAHDHDVMSALLARTDPARMRIDLQRAPLLQAHVGTAPHEGEWLLSLLFHHLVCDHISLERIIAEVAGLLDQPPRQPAPSMPYRDFIARVAATPAAHHEQYFRDRLGDVMEPCAPFDTLAAYGRDTRFNKHYLAIPSALATRLRHCAQSAGVTPASMFHLAWSLVLARCCGRADVVFGTVLSGRLQGLAGLDHALGMFLNTLPLRVNVDDTSVTAALMLVHRRLGELMVHEQAPLTLAQGCSGVAPDRPLFTTIINYRHNSRPVSPAQPGWAGVRWLRSEERSNYPIGLIIDDDSVRLDCTLHAQDGVDGAGLLDWLHTGIEALVTALTDTPTLPTGAIEVLSRTASSTLLRQFHGPSEIWPDLPALHGLVEHQARLTPDAVAIVCGERQLRYAELDAQAARLAATLRATVPVTADSRIALCLERGVDMIVAMLAILKAGAAYVPLDPDYPDARLGAMLQDCAPLALLIQPALRRRLDSVTHVTTVIVLEPDLADLAPVTLPRATGAMRKTQGADLAYIIYTSGSTGVPKGVMVGHHNVVNTLLARRQYLPRSARMLLLPSIGFDCSILAIFGTLLDGGTVHVADPELARDAVAVAGEIGQQALDAMLCTPSFARQVLEHLAPATTLRTLVVGGEACPPTLPALAQRHAPGLALFNEYGPTEAAITCTVHQCLAPDGAAIPLGRALANTRLYILDRRGRPVPMGVAGELHIGGAGVARGYLGNACLSAERFLPDPFSGLAGARLYRTGDLVRGTAGGVLEFLGRIDAQVKIRGYRVEPGEVEASLARQEGVAEAAVAARPDRRGDAALVAYVVPAAGTPPDLSTLRGALALTLPEHMLPTALVLLKALPLTAHGKCDYTALPAPPDGPAHATYAAPCTSTERLLCDIWQEVLGLDQVGVTDNFFQLGGHSLLATRLVARINQRLGVALALKTVFAAPVLQQLALALVQPAAAPAPALAPVLRDRALPLSYAQQRLWMLDRLHPGSTQYNLLTALRLSGPLNTEAVYAACAGIVARHESLRTCFIVDEAGQPLQQIVPAALFAVTTSDISTYDADNRYHAIERLMREESARPFDLGTDFKLRVHLVITGPGEHMLLVCMHHIAADGWSTAILVREFSALYMAATHGKPAALAPLPIQYADYACWQRQWLDGGLMQSQLAFWDRQLANLPVVHSLPLDFPRPARQRFAGAVHACAIDAHTSAALRALCRAHDATLFMGVHAAFAVLLARHSNERDIVVGAPSANREQPEIAGLIGFFVNTLVLRSDLSGTPDFHTLIEQSKATLLDAYSHQQAPFEQLVERLRPERRLNHSPLFQIMLAMNNNAQHNLELPGLEAELLAPPAPHARYDLTLNASDSGDGLQLAWEYDTALFTTTTIEGLAQRFHLLLQAMVTRPDDNVFSLPMLYTGITDSQPYPDESCIHTLFEQQVRRTPDAVALVFRGSQLTYHQLNARANALAHHLRTSALKPETVVGLCLERSPELVIAMLAILKAGGAYLPLDPDYPPARLGYMIADAGLKVVITERALLQRLGLPPETALCLDDAVLAADLAGALQSDPPPPDAGSDSLAYVLYTSGSTGQPKGVMVGHRALVNRIHWMERRYGSAPDDCVLQKTPISFDVSVWEFFWPLTTGSRLVMAPPGAHVDAVGLRELIRSERITRLHFVPHMLGHMLSTGQLAGCTSLRQVFCSGEALPLQHARAFRTRLPHTELHNLYGPTEAAIDVSHWDCVALHEELSSVPIGVAIDNITLYVLNEALALAPPGTPGELYIGGIGLARGYLGRPDLTAEKFIANPYHQPQAAGSSTRLYKTGDLARWGQDGNLEYIGRLDHQVKLRGVRIEPGDIENAILSSGAVRDAVVALRQGANAEPCLVAYLVPQAPATFTAEDLERLRRHLVGQLPPAMLPAHLVVLAQMPLTPAGKVDRKALPAFEAPAAMEDYVPPRTDLERRLAAAWGAQLGMKATTIGIHANFFALGGHSMQAITLLSSLRTAVDVPLSLQMLFELPTIAQLAHRIETLQGTSVSAEEREAPPARRQHRLRWD